MCDRCVHANGSRAGDSAHEYSPARHWLNSALQQLNPRSAAQGCAQPCASIHPGCNPVSPGRNPVRPGCKPMVAGAPQQLEMLLYHEVSAPRLVCTP